MSLDANAPLGRWLLLALTVFTFFFLLGARALNEPDEGRYAEVAREMIETRDWLVPHIWYVPHLDKPPLTYWAVAASMASFGPSEWAVRLPVALAGLSGVWAVCLLGGAIGGQRAGLWSALILQSSLLYFVMARMLTTDIFLTQFIAWSLYFFWRSWRSLDGFTDDDEALRARAGKGFFGWHLAGWTAMALGFLTKGPIALAVPLATMAALAVYCRKETVRWQLLILGALAGTTLMALLVVPWFAAVFQAMPRAFDYMVKGQVAGHLLGTAIKNRSGSPFYYFGILALGFLPWTVLVGWLWRRTHWRSLGPVEKEGWLFLSAWVFFTFTLFSFSRAKLPAYILPLFPALAALVAVRWFGESGRWAGPDPRAWVWRSVMLSPWLAMAAFSLTMRLVFDIRDQAWIWVLLASAILGFGLFLRLGKAWSSVRCARVALALALLNLGTVAIVIPTVESRLKGNQTLEPLAEALRGEYHPGDVIVCWGRLPQGLPFYAFPAINAAHRPYLGAIPMDGPPYEFPGNRERMGKLVLADGAAFGRLLEASPRVLVVGFEGAYRQAQSLARHTPCRFLKQVGRWELFANR
ncbi:MAG: ArnT family glycosyltransferase [Limisphaerales bacterium]